MAEYAICHQDDIPILNTVLQVVLLSMPDANLGLDIYFLVWSLLEKVPESFIAISVVCCTWLMVLNENRQDKSGEWVMTYSAPEKSHKIGWGC